MALVAVGPSGLGYSLDDGSSWTAIDTVGYNTVAPAADGLAWVAGTEGRVVRLAIPGR